MSAQSQNTRASRQAAKKASTKFEAQLMSSPEKLPAKPTRPVKPTKSRPNLRKEYASSSSVGLSKSAPPRPRARKRPVSLDSHRSDDDESDLTSLSTPRGSPTIKSRPAPPKLPPAADFDATSSHVWVLVNFNGEVFQLEDEDDGVERIWWPAKKTEHRVHLYGTIGASNDVAVDTLHDGNNLPLADNDKIRFTAPKHVILTASPKKRQKLDIADLDAKWWAAFTEVVDDYIEEEMPSTLFLSSLPKPPPHVPSSQAKPISHAASSKPSSAPLHDRWSPPPPDMSIEIPGEKVLAREFKKNSKEYWPALILGYVEPSNPSEIPLYRIRWVDGLTADIPRDYFYLFEEDGFGLCKMGPFESLFKEVTNDKDEPDAPKRPRGPSPEPRDPAPDMQTFCNLGMHKQFAYTKPVLQAILRNEYPPARELHDKFVSGKPSDQNWVIQFASQSRGLMDPGDVEELHRCLVEWCLRDSVKGIRVSEESEQGDDVAVGEVAVADNDVVPAKDDGPERPTSSEAHILDPENTKFSLAVVDFAIDEDPAAQETLCNPPSPTPTCKDDDASSPPLPPPSSSFSIIGDVDVSADVKEVDAQEGTMPMPEVDDAIGDAFDTASVLTDASDISALVSLETPPPQVGCPAYEQLQPLRKLDYCLNVLLPELLIQINVWRTGKRRSVALLSEEEEAELHELGLAERAKTDWVGDVMRLRTKKEELLRSREKVIGGTSSRPKKALSKLT